MTHTEFTVPDCREGYNASEYAATFLNGVFDIQLNIDEVADIDARCLSQHEPSFYLDRHIVILRGLRPLAIESHGALSAGIS
jgi:hypothetical protein